MLRMDRGKTGEINKWTKQFVLHLVLAFCGSHPKKGCRRFACKDLHTAQKEGTREVSAKL